MESIYLYMGLIGSVFFTIKLALILFGHDADVNDLDAMDPDNLDFKFLSIQTLSIFIASVGWMGLLLHRHFNLDIYASFSISFIFGILCAYIQVWTFTKVKGLAQINKLDLNNAIGKVGIVYLDIPENGVGEIQISFQGSMKNCKAVSETSESISAFVQIEVTSVRNNLLVIKKV